MRNRVNRTLINDKSTYGLVQRLLKESVRPYVRWIVLALICMAIVAAATAASAWLMKPVINDVFVAKNKDFRVKILIFERSGHFSHSY